MYQIYLICPLIGYFIFKIYKNRACGEPKIVQRNYADQMELAYDPVFSWLNAKDVKVISLFHF